MRDFIRAVALIVTATHLTGAASADQAADRYRAAMDRGDLNAAYRAASYLSPGYCYDLNRWHGITFTKAVNGRVAHPSYPFTYQDMTDTKVRQLYDRAGIAAMEQESHTEFELIRRISDWANIHWGHMQPLPYPSWDAMEILDKAESGDAFWCTFKAVLFVQACNSAGITGRILGINLPRASAHTVTEVWSNDFRKWVLVDPWLNAYFERDGIPMSALELHDDVLAGNTESIVLVFGENGRGTEYFQHKVGTAETIPHANARIPLADDPSKGASDHYFDIRIVLRNDHTTHPQSTENRYIDGFMVPYNARGDEWWGPQLKWSDDDCPPQLTCWNTNDLNDFYWPLNEVRADLMKVSVPGEPAVIEARFSTMTPNFSHYALEVNGVESALEADTFTWKLTLGTNTLRVASVNDLGRRGFTSEFELTYDPSVLDFSRRVTVELPNPGMEDEDDKTGAPASWRTITSNGLGSATFTRDSGEKHSGGYSLKAAPARDRKTGVEYAFIVKSANFEVNPSTDVACTIWLKADRDGTPVDIALLESTYKGLGTYVERVTVDRTWKRYELRCRLHNELTNAYVAFKVYTGTVWADDADITEVR